MRLWMSQRQRTSKLPAVNPLEPPYGGLSLYIHVPFCGRKCPYCAFESKVPSEGERELWLEQLKKEFLWWRERIGVPSLKTCYIGGGTPTMLSGPQWKKLIESVEDNFTFFPDSEVTVEANPNSLAAEHLLEWRDWRVTRVSLGVQSFDDAELEMLGRLHSAAQAYEAVSASLASGFEVSIDLMFGLPYQTLQNWARSLKDGVKTGVKHISLDQLSLEENTPWQNMDRALLSDGYVFYRWAQWYLAQKGYNQYETANFSKPGFESRHNLNYWREGDYLGVGPSASGYLRGWRYKNVNSLREYELCLAKGTSAVSTGERLSPEASAKEASVLALRTFEGINTANYALKYGEDALSCVFGVLNNFPKELWTFDGEKITLTKKGMRVANIIWEELV